MNVTLRLAFALIVGSVPAVTQACRVFIPPETRITTRIADGTIVAVAQVEIIDARPLRKAEADIRPWKADARIVGATADKSLPATVQFERGWGSAACEWGAPPLPRSGDRWVVYFWGDREAVRKPWLAISVAEADRFDPNWRKRVR